MNAKKFNKADTNLFNAKSNISNLVYLKYDISKIEIDTESSIRHEYDPEKLKELAESIRTNNNELIQPIVISNIRNSGEFRVIAGRRRFLACRDILKLKTISAIVKNYDDEMDEFHAQFTENEERENWTDYDYVKAIKMFESKHPNLNESQRAAIFGKSIDWYRKKKQHMKVIQDIPNATPQELSKIPTSHAIELTRLPKEKKEKVFKELGELAKNNLPFPTIKKIRKNISESILDENELSKINNEIKGIKTVWEKFGKILDSDKPKLINFYNQEKKFHKRDLAIANNKTIVIQRKLASTEQFIKLLEDETLFESGIKVKKKTAGKK